ncbi:MAG: BatA and WFA domain-containing protein [Bryobacteraceae bacterium]|nr:BatA and WFA domain-containing protein [Bryobacteraceae bacterium]MDW8379086.1 BatA and WFA domain-containing protein [Bryobacterales bacterium]
MFFFNLSGAEFVALLSAVSSFVLLLYLLDRSRRKLRVATLRFWQDSTVAVQRQRRRRIQQPWSLLLQLIASCLLLLAIAQLRLGSPERSWRDHVLLVDASAWMGARNASNRLLMEEAKALAVQYVRALPSSDRVMVVRADALATPLTGFESRKPVLEAAINQLQPGVGALNLAQNLEFAAQAMRLEGKRAGEIAYAGPGRLTADGLRDLPPTPRNLRVLWVPAHVENIGIRKLSARRATTDSELWQLYLTARNYGQRRKEAPLIVSFGGAPVASRLLALAPQSEADFTFEFRTRAAGWLEARLQANDSFPRDDSATVELPAARTLRVTVYSPEPELLRPLLAAHRRLTADFRRPNDDRSNESADLLIFDRCRPLTTPKGSSLWIEPPRASSPIPVRTERREITLRWRNDQLLAAGLRSEDTKLESTQVFAAAESDIPIAEVEGGPAIVARNGPPKIVVMGFHPLRSALRYQLVTPLLFANILQWMAPEAFQRIEIQATSIGLIRIPLLADHEPERISVVSEGQTSVPFTLRDRTLRFFSGAPGIVRVNLGDREVVQALSLPEVGEAQWEPPKQVMRGLARVSGGENYWRETWHWLALVAAFILVVEWMLFGRGSSRQLAANLLRFPWRRSRFTAQRKAS